MQESKPIDGPWIDRATTLCEEDPRQTYFALLNSQLCGLFPEFVRNIQTQLPHEREMSRVAVIEYQGEEQNKQQVFKGSKGLQNYFQRSAYDEPVVPQQRLFLLEDLSLNCIEVLGSQLRIPPSFFGAHWADPATPTFNYRSPFCRYSEEGFVIRYPETLPVRIDAPDDVHGIVFRYNSNVDRHIQRYDPKGPLIDQPKTYHALSFWTSGVRKDGSWDSVLIVDPPVGEHVKSLSDSSFLKVDHTSAEHAYTRMHSLAPDFNDTRILPPDAFDWSQGWIHPQYNCMFDDILSITHSTQAQAMTPRTCTEIARKLVITNFITFLRRRILNMLRLQANPRTRKVYVNRCDYLREFGHGVLSSWHHELFGFVVNVKYIMGIMAKEADDNVVALGLNRDGTAVPQWERDGWIAVQEYCGNIIAMAEAFLQSYLQFTTMQEAQAANRNALSLARITNLTMVFIPLSTIAAIFSMTDEFLPGKSKSWIFWVTALPILCVTFAMKMESRLVLREYWKTFQERRRTGRNKALHMS